MSGVEQLNSEHNTATIRSEFDEPACSLSLAEIPETSKSRHDELVTSTPITTHSHIISQSCDESAVQHEQINLCNDSATYQHHIERIYLGDVESAYENGGSGDAINANIDRSDYAFDTNCDTRVGEQSPVSFNSVTVCNESSTIENVSVPIVGYDVQEKRAKFTIFKLQVKRNEDSWCIFRRYTDFVRLNDKLAHLFPHYRLSLPPKRWFGNNFDHNFLEDRMLGLQAFINNVTGNRNLLSSFPARQFFCLDHPPSPFDTLEGCKATCESLEERCYELEKENEEKEHTINLLREEIEVYKTQLESLQKTVCKSSGSSKDSRNTMAIKKSHIDYPKNAQEL